MGISEFAAPKRRRQIASSFQVDDSKGVSSKPDGTEDSQLEINGQSV